MEPAGENPAENEYTQDAAGDPQRDRAEAGDRRQQNRHENRGGQKPDDSAKQAAVDLPNPGVVFSIVGGFLAS